MIPLGATLVMLLEHARLDSHVILMASVSAVLLQCVVMGVGVVHMDSYVVKGIVNLACYVASLTIQATSVQSALIFVSCRQRSAFFQLPLAIVR